LEVNIEIKKKKPSRNSIFDFQFMNIDFWGY